MEAKEGVRINKFLSEIGFCSRRKADELVEAGKVQINGMPAVNGSKVHENDKVSVNGKNVNQQHQNQVYLAFNKPIGIVCTTDTVREKDNIINYINYPRRIFPIGRLDKNSQGLILLTSDGDIVNKILRAGNYHEKEYIVTVDKPVDAQFIKKMSNGLPILGTVTRKCVVEKISSNTFRIILTQGLNRQIRRMCEFLDYKVTRLQRVRIMHIQLDLPKGKWRELTPGEMLQLNEAIKDSYKTYEKKSPLE